MSSSREIHRRAFLNFPAASPILASAGFESRRADDVMAAQAVAQGAPGDQTRNEVTIKSVYEAQTGAPSMAKIRRDSLVTRG